ncbi:MAG: carboxypeptidase regulatory-like domain-containing protein [Flavobacterium sp.]|uniref:carboxypeptidase-like regulatory domain-containing protein n=1 Tax=Flavobacterium sp. TaxID=239 RepID=UPI0011FD3D43|nr:carboxypeptidase-like regulatory domain-containing protein [Flavobacterium sp.]RZJ66536.1 MAG: carboxypeptidase regulatory-like domain-containing protein [Flavobacterium sp.]
MRKVLLLIPILCVFISCDKEVGSDGVVQDSETGQSIAGVNVKMKSEDQGSETDVTDSEGYFNIFKISVAVLRVVIPITPSRLPKKITKP